MPFSRAGCIDQGVGGIRLRRRWQCTARGAATVPGGGAPPPSFPPPPGVAHPPSFPLPPARLLLPPPHSGARSSWRCRLGLRELPPASSPPRERELPPASSSPGGFLRRARGALHPRRCHPPPGAPSTPGAAALHPGAAPRRRLPGPAAPLLRPSSHSRPWPSSYPRPPAELRPRPLCSSRRHCCFFRPAEQPANEFSGALCLIGIALFFAKFL